MTKPLVHHAPRPVILGPSGRPAFVEQIAAHNRRNRAKLNSQIGNWKAHFAIDEVIELRGVRFRILRKWEDVMLLGMPTCKEDREQKWWHAFLDGRDQPTRAIFPLKGFEFVIQSHDDIRFNGLSLTCRGPTGRRRKGHWND